MRDPVPLWIEPRRRTPVHLKRTFSIGMATVLLVAGCSSSASPSPSTPGPTTEASTAATSPSAAASEAASPSAAASASAAPLAVDPAEAVITGVEPNAEIHFWTFYLDPPFGPWIQSTIARFQQTYPGVKVDWRPLQASFQTSTPHSPPATRRT